MRRLALEEAAALVRATDTLAVPLGPGIPTAFLHALGKREDFTDLRVFGALLVDFFPLFTRPGVRLLSGFFGPVERALLAGGHDVQFVPGDFRRFAKIAHQLAPRVMATCAAPPDADGRLSLALHAGATVAEMHAAARDPERLLVVEVNPKLPRTLGLPPDHPHGLSIYEVDVLVESDRDIVTLPELDPTPTERAIAEHVTPLVTEGSTLQTGIGGVPNAVASLLAQGSGGDYGIHSEMFTDGLMHLVEAGKVSNRKGIFDGYAVCTFALGTRALYDWLDDQEAVRFLPVHLTNDPSLIARNRKMISINGALSVDLVGQIVADQLNGVEHSGIGGHEDFVSGAAFSEGGRSMICLPSTADTPRGRVSRIVSRFAAGTCVTTPRHQVDAIVTEYGVAELAGLTVKERAEALVAVAHPEFREALGAQAAELPVLPVDPAE